MRVPWRDRQGRFLKFKAAVLACTPIPGLLWAYWWIDGDLSGRALNDVIHGMGSWTVRWLMLALAITPFARIVDTSSFRPRPT
jgi:methionine sulfoxide reductase heme-binding subunit